MAVALGLVVLLAAAASASACPNEALRSELRSEQLPDCRAYERVSPAYKDGSRINSLVAASPEGSRFIVGDLGAFGGAEEEPPIGAGSANGVVYEFSRTSAGWEPISLAPPASRYHGRGLFDVSADLSSSVWELGLEEGQPEQLTDLYLEQPRGTFTKIGPATPGGGVNASQYIWHGGSADLSRSLFSNEPGYRWSFDGTAASGGTLYEYVGVEQPHEIREPLLVGVSGGHGSNTLVSHCGTRLGSSSSEEHVKGSMYNAISASGARVFFTAVGTNEASECEGPPVSELLAREELSSTESRTVPISEPSLEYCSPSPPALAPPCASAHFEGASLDGSKVFFTSTQSLLAGASEASENLYEYDFASPAQKLALVSAGAAGSEGAKVQGVARISEDGSHVYFVAQAVLTDAPNGIGRSAEAGEDNLYVYDTENGQTAFVATLSLKDGGDWQRADSRPVMASGDGRFLVFTSFADPIGEGLGGEKSQVFQYDAATGVLVRASIGQDGYNADNTAPVAGSAIILMGTYDYTETDSPVAANGSQAAADGAVFLQSANALTPGALNDRLSSNGETLVPNVYEYRAGNVYLLSDGHDINAFGTSTFAQLVGSDPSGNDVFLTTVDPLIPSDLDTLPDVYDARVEGGFPTPAPLPGCSGESCRGPLALSPPLSPLGGSATQAAEEVASPGVPAPPVVKPKPKVKKKPKVAKKSKAAKKRKSKTARKARRAGLRGHVHERTAR
jgi:hypothetical protein